MTRTGTNSRVSKVPVVGAGRVSLAQWALGVISLIFSLFGYLTSRYETLGLLATVLMVTNLVLLGLVAKEALRTRLLGKFFLMASCLVFFWVDAVDLARNDVPFAIPRGLPIGATQFDLELLQDGLFYVALFQLLLLAGYRLGPRLTSWSNWVAGRRDIADSYYKPIVFLLAACALMPFLMSYDFNILVALDALIAARSEAIEAQDIGLLQVLYYFGMFGVSVLLVESFAKRGKTRILSLALALIAVVPYVYGGTRHLLLYISLPLIVICPRLFPRNWNTSRVGATVAIMIMLLAVFQLQFTLRDVGWSNIRDVSLDDFTHANVTGQFGALLFAEYLVPDTHEYFLEPAEFYFFTQWIPRKFWPDKPVMESWNYFNSSYAQDWEFNVTPSVIGQYHMNWGIFGVMAIAIWLGFLTCFADRCIAVTHPRQQMAIVVVVGMFYAFIISSFRFYSPIYFSYFLFAFICMFFLTKGRKRTTLTSSFRFRPVHATTRYP